MNDLRARSEGPPSFSPQLSEAARDLLARRAARASGIPRGAAGAPAPLSFVQQRIWLFEQMNPGTSAYNLPKLVRLAGALDVPALRAAVEAIVARHEVLRAGVAIGDEGEPLQRVLPGTRVPLDYHDLGGLPPDAREPAALEGARALANAPFDLERGPLVRAALFRLGDDEHMLSLTLHHLAFDGWSSALLLRELSALYDGATLPAPAVQYADYARWQRDGVARGMERELAWWREALAGAPAANPIPTDAPRTATRGGVRAARATRMLDARLAAAVLDVARAESATPFMVCLAAFQLLVARLSGQDDVVVGCPVAGRTRPETEGTIGCFINVLPLRARVAGDASFRALLAAVRRTAVGAFDNQALPFERIVEALQPARGPGVTPFAQLLFNYRNWPAAPPAMRGLRVDASGRGATDTTAGHDLTLYVEEQPDGALRLDVTYDARLLSVPRVEEMLRQYAQLLAHCVSRPDAAVGGHSLVTEHAGPRLPDPAAPLELPWRGAVHELFSARAASDPHRTAVAGATTWSYGELEAHCNRIAHALRDVGVRRGDRVAIYAHRDATLPLALLGVLKAGAAFVVLDSAYPAARLAACVAAARPRVLLCLSGAGAPAPLLLHAARALPEQCTRLDLADGADWWMEGRPATPPDVPIGPDDVAYVAFTSGTTGTPKGVVGRHGSLSAFTAWRAAEFGLGADDRFSLLSGLAHDPLHRDLFTPLELGACLVVPEPGDAHTPERLRRWVRGSAVTVANLTPAMGRLLVSGAEGDEPLESLRRVFLVGDALTPRDAARLRAAAPRALLVSYYGATETQQALGVHVVTDADADEATAPTAVPLGRGAPGVQLLVVNGAGGRAGIGEVGEILVRSPALAAGYLDDPALTDARFVATPGGASPADRAYRTGDLGRYLPDGGVSTLGRADRQVKVRGFRVELADVESALGAHPAVRECAVVACADAGGELALHGYAVVAPGGEASAAELRRHVQGLLPGYMVPATITPLAAMPLTPNGKLDRAALPAPAAASSSSHDAHVPPRDGIEETLAEIWRELLGVDRVGVTDDFFALGGHSLLAVAMVDRAGARLGARPPLDALFREPTIASLAAALRDWHGGASALVTLREGEPGSAPFFFLHGDFNGGGFACRRLPAYFPRRRPLYLLTPHAPGGPVTIEAMADEFLTLIRRVRPRGPYLLGGHCNGGLVAFEMARRLRQAGERVDALVLIDPPHNNHRFAPLHAAVRAAGAAFRWDEARRADVFVEMRDAIIRRRAGLPAGAARGPAFALRLLSGSLGWAAARLAGSGRDAPAVEPRAAYIRRAVRSYVPGSYPGRLHVLWARGPHVEFAADHTAGWHRSVAELRVDGFPGGHSDAFTRHFDALARALSATLESAAAAAE